MSISPNLVFNRLYPGILCELSTVTAASSVFARFHEWRRSRTLQRHSSEAAAKIKSSLPEGFSPRSFATRCRADYEKLFLALERGDLHTLKRTLSSACMASTRAGQEGRVPLRARIIAWNEADSGVSACGTYALSKDASSSDKPPDFVQVTMRNAFTVELRGAAPAGELPLKRTPVGLPLLPLWETCLHQGSGTLYWWDRVSGKTTWQMPNVGSFHAAVPHYPWRLESTGSWEATPALQDSGAQRAKVVHDVVWEKAVAGGGWYIVRW
jgi:hypothetical protein